MAGDWIKMEVSTPDKPEVLAIAARMGWDDPDLVVGKLFRVWRWFDQHTVEGNAATVTLALLDRISGVSGFAKAMESVGWLTISDDGISLPKFDRHCGKTAKERALGAKRVANHKSNALANGVGNAEANGISNDKTNGASVSSALPREEKRRDLKEASSVDDLTKIAYDAGVELFAGTRAQPQARSIVGMLRKHLGDEKTIELLRAARDKSEPVEYVMAAYRTAMAMEKISKAHGGAAVVRLHDGRLRCGPHYFSPEGRQEMAI